MSHHRDLGFTTIELLIAMIIGALFLLTITQLYMVTMRDSTEVRNRTNASAAAYDILRREKIQPQGMCAIDGPRNVSVPSYIELPPTATATIALSCPYGEGTSPTRIEVIVTYGTKPTQKATYAAYQAN